ncbi:MAG TPA: P63C domain-containing protein [Pyrinomonadaceae bacterium]|nr:P63C domain-containing protein [Pyrinomonadaceae bacterium]
MENEKNLSKVRGGLARAEALTKTEKVAIARKGAEARWGEKITHEGMLNLAGIEIPCYVTENEKRVLSGRGMQEALRLVDDTYTGQKSGSRLGRLFSYTALQPLILQAKEAGRFEPVKLTFKGQVIHGYEAEALADLCVLLVDAQGKGLLKTKRQKLIGERAAQLLGAFARVGLNALIDEATGFQYTRARNALEVILTKFIQKDLRKWVKTFPDEFYFHICRLRGWDYNDENKNKRGPLWGKITNHLIYDRLAPGVKDELKRLTPRDAKGRHKQQLFRRLTEDVGHPRLRELLASEITLMRIFDDGDWEGFEKALNRAVPIYRRMPLFEDIEKYKDDTAKLLH